MKKIHYLLALPLVFILIQCKSSKESTSPKSTEVYVPSDKQMELANKRWANTTADELKEGKTIYTTKCTSCHKNFEEARFTEKKWLHELDVMAPKAKLTVEEKTKLTKYILSMREATAKPAKG